MDICSLAITKLDVLDDFDEVKIGIAYELDGEKNYDSFPGEASVLFILLLYNKENQMMI